MTRFSAWRHRRALRRTRWLLGITHDPEDFLLLRQRAFALDFCTGPETCYCFTGKPLRKLVHG